MAYQMKGSKNKQGFVLGRVKSFPPAERVASLVVGDKGLELIPLSTPYEKMGFLKGVFTRDYEEFHYLEMALARQASAYSSEQFAKQHSISSINAQLSMATSLGDQGRISDWAAQENSIASAFLDPMEAARKAALGDSASYLDQHLASSNLAAQAAKDFSSSTIESYARDLTNSETAYKAAMGSSLSSASEAVAGLSKNYTSLLDDDVRESLKGSHASIREAIAPQSVKIPEPKDTLPPLDVSPFKYIDEQNARLRKEQRERDDRQKQQTKNSEALLRLHTEQIEKNRKLQEEQRRDSRFTKKMAIAALIVSIISAVIPAL